jgi:hypothetical protein
MGRQKLDEAGNLQVESNRTNSAACVKPSQVKPETHGVPQRTNSAACTKRKRSTAVLAGRSFSNAPVNERCERDVGTGCVNGRCEWEVRMGGE